MVNTIAITGVSGFIGNELADYFLLQGKTVIGLSRTEVKKNAPQFSYVPYDLEKEPDFFVLKKADVIIHCAFLVWTEENSKADRINIEATLRLAEFCERENKRFVFLSSFSAHGQATSHYGKHKFELENILKEKHLVIKPGLVLGKKGLFSTISKLVSEKKFIPIIGNGLQPLQWITINELCCAIEMGINRNLTGLFPLASEKSITFLALNELIAAKKNRSPYFIFVHPFIASLLLAMFRKKMPFTNENLKGLLQLREFDTKESLEKLQISVGPIEDFSL